MFKVLFATSEAYPLIKTGGLGDVAGSLPAALKALGCDIRLVLPAYRGVLAQARVEMQAHPLPLLGTPGPVRVLEGVIGTDSLPVYLVDAPELFDRPGGPYTGPQGGDWHDNAQRFSVFSRAVIELAQDRPGLAWRPEVIHCNDWQTGLVPALLAHEPRRPATVFTIHNLAYQGLFDWNTFAALHLPHPLFSPEAMEFYGQFSFIKGGLAFADMLTTVSPSYAREIQTPEFGCGLDGLLRHRAADLVGILNGVDYAVWDPRHDAFIAQRYATDTLASKSSNKLALQRALELPENPSAPLLGIVARLVQQKGLDLFLDAVPHLWDENIQLAILGEGDDYLQGAVQKMRRERPHQISIKLGFDEPLAHRIVAGADALVMPSRFEPCGLNQMYALRYGTIPIVRRVGGLADTVVDATEEALDKGLATGIVFGDATAEALVSALSRALALYRSEHAWVRLQLTGMAQDYSWSKSAGSYREIYARARGRVGGSG